LAYRDFSNIVDFIGVGETEHQAVIRTVVAEESEPGTDVFEEEEEKEPVNIFLVQEFCNNGSLQNLLEKNMALGVQSLKVYSVVNALEYAIHIAKGLEYLHLASPMIIHRDLKPGEAAGSVGTSGAVPPLCMTPTHLTCACVYVP
jgi:serine/threonine protein kinase